ncbi:hypothetical protein RDWZM_009050 [Blomia tropicalis]|uniref:Nucleoprotein TPR n=1 Tax=Blomia tropicalis TaxID=40697 RepID=A0A9Q0M0M9_BLOTA|nr:hypothetical protein RDWZM_009050 [Blomia tropicalis]
MDYNQFQQPSSIDGLSSANYERELQSLKLNLQMVQNFSDDLKRQLHETEEALKKSENNNFEISQNNNLLKSEVKMLEAKADDLQKHKLDLVQMLSRKNDEIEYLKSTKPNNDDSMSFRSDDTQMLQCAESLNDVRLKEIRLNFEEKRLKNERNLYQNQIKLLQEEISTKNTELLNVRKEGNLNVMQANLKIDDQSNEIKCLHSEINRLKTMNDNKDKNISELTKSHLDLQLNCTQLEAKYNQENEAQSELISLLMKQNEEIQSDFTLKLDELEKYRELLKQAYEAHKALEERFNLMKESFKDEVKEMESEKQQLLMRLDQASKDAADTNRQLIEEQFERYFPIAVENNRSLNNKVNLSELYSQFVQCKLQNAQLLEQNQKLQAEVSNLSEQFDQEKPIMYKNYKDIELVSKRCVELQEELDRQIDIHKDLMSEKDKDIRTINQLKREIEYYNNENGFLSLQIQSLLRSEQEERGFKVPEQSPNSDITDTLTIPYELITFNGIKDLQQKNRELLRLVHRMSEDMDCDGQDFNHSSTNEIELNRLKEDLDKYKQEIEQLQSELDKKTDELNQQNKSKSNENSFEFSFHEKRDLLTENRELKHKLEKMNKDIETLRLDNMNDVRRLEEMKNKLIEETINLKAELSKQSAESFRQNGHIENLNLTNEKVLDENQTLRERNIKLNAKIENLEKNLINVSSEIETLRQQSKSIEQELHIARSQRDIAVNNESNLIQENSRINIELETQKKMVYSLKAMQTNIERMESETVRGLQQQLKQLQTNNDYYREKIEQQDEKWKKSFTDFSTQIENHQTLLEKEKNQHIDLQGKYFQLQSSYQKLLDEMKNTMATTNQNNQIEQQHSGSIVASGELCRQLASLQDEVKVLKGKLKNSELSYENLKSINSSLETNLQKLIVNNQEIKANLDNEMATRLKVIEELNVELANTRQQYETIVEEKVKIIEQMQSSNDLSISKINELNQQLSAAREATRKAREDERKVLDDLNFQTIIGIRSQEDYEKEVALRSSDAKTIQQLKSDLSDLEKRSAEKERELETLRDQLTMNRELSATQQQTLTTEMEVAKKRCSLLENVNENVLAQLDQLNNQIIALKNNSTLFALTIMKKWKASSNC